jgi:hypothetical protein
MQEHRKVLADRQVAAGDHLVRRGAHHHPVVVAHRQAQQGIAHRAADTIGLHGGSLAAPARPPGSAVVRRALLQRGPYLARRCASAGGAGGSGRRHSPTGWPSVCSIALIDIANTDSSLLRSGTIRAAGH